MPTLTALASGHGFTVGDLDSDGYIAAVPAFQKLYVSDGRTEYTTTAPDFTGGGLDDMIIGGTYSGTTSLQYKIEIDGEGTPDTFKWSDDGGSTWDATTVNITGAAQTLNNGITITFAATTGHTEGEDWTFTATHGYHKLDFINTKLVGTASGAFTAGEVLEQAVSGAKGVFDETVGSGATAQHFVYRITTTQFNTTNVVTGATSGETVTPSSVTAPPHWLKWTLTDGSFPDGGSNISSLYLGRIFLNDMYHPHQWLALRQGNPLDSDTSQDDIGAAVSSQTSGFAGKIGSPLVSFIPYKNYYIIFGCVNEMWIMRGDPSTTSSFANITYDDGIFSPDSWCFDDKGNLYWVGINGFYRLPVGAAVSDIPPENITLGKYPNYFTQLQVNRRTDRISVEYDNDRFGILFTIVMKDGAWASSFFYDLRTEALLPEDYADNAIPASMYYFNAHRGDYRRLLFGGQDGYIRYFDEDAKDDDNGDSDSAIDSYVVLGPIDLSPLTRGEGKLEDLVIDLSEDTDGLDWALYAEDSAEALIDGIDDATLTAIDSGTFSSGGHQNSIRKKVKGKWLAIKLQNDTASESWGLDGIEAKIKLAGKK